MTNKQAIELLKWFGEYNDIDYHGGDMIENDKGDRFYRVVKEDLEAFDMAIKALSQQTEDAISRQAAVHIAKEECENGSYNDIPWKLEGLPSVNPQEPKTGHWEIISGNNSRCSICGVYNPPDCFNRPVIYNYCPFCGAKMEG